MRHTVLHRASKNRSSPSLFSWWTIISQGPGRKSVTIQQKW